MRETIGIDLGGDESKLSETPMQAPKEFKTRDFRITPEILEKLGKDCLALDIKTTQLHAVQGWKAKLQLMSG